MSRVERQPEPLKRMQALKYAATLAQLGARPPTISGLLPYLPESLIKDVYAEVTGARSKRGPTPYTLHAHFSSPLRRIQSSYALVTFLRYRETGIHDIDAMVATYKGYCQIFGEQGDQAEQKGLTFDRLWFLIRNYANDRLVTLEKCPACGLLHIHDPSELLTARDCPFAKLIPDFNAPVAHAKRVLTADTKAEPLFAQPAVAARSPVQAGRPLLN